MRILLIFFVTLMTAGTVYSQNHQGAFIAFDRETHEYGKISAEDVPDGTIKFKVYNRGNQPLVLSTVRACCGTSVAGYTQQPIAPSDSGYVEVQFRIVPQPHRISRTVTIQSNAANRQTAILRILGEVVEPTGDISLQE